MVTRSPDIPEEIWRRIHRGCRGEKKLSKAAELRKKRLMEKRRYKPCVPSLIKGEHEVKANKMEELMVLAWSQREYWECSIMCFTETWLHQDIPDDNFSISG